ncbi:MAG TPA: AsmA-like C-terminal region-containing protein, partial [Acidiphilium sp.]
MTRGRIIAVLVIVCVIVLGVAFGPLLVSGNYHRAAIERLASRLAGRQVTIAGPIQLALIPDPQIRASKITIGGANGALTTAASLKLDLAPGALLLGKLRATRLSLRGPDIALPWPLPGGADAVAPPPWLASLHARIEDGQLAIGALHFTNADLSVFTGGPHAVLAASGTAKLGTVPVSLSIEVDDASGDAPAPVTASLGLTGDKNTHLDFHGTLARSGLLAGTLTGVASAKTLADAGLNRAFSDGAATLHATIAADGEAIALRDIDAVFGKAGLAGSAIIDLNPGTLIRLDLSGHDVDPAAALGFLHGSAVSAPFATSLDLNRVTLGGIGFSSLKAAMIADDGGVRVQSLTGVLPGQGTATFTGGTDTDGKFAGKFTLRTADLPATLAAIDKVLPHPANWPPGYGTVTLTGTVEGNGGATPNLRFSDLRGTIGGAGPDPVPASAFTGAIHLSGGGKTAHIAARLDFDRLTLTRPALAALLDAAARPDPAFTGPIALTARSVGLESGDTKPAILPVGTRLLIDAELGDGVAVRLASLHIGPAMLILHGVRAKDGKLTSGRAILAGPDASATIGAILPLLTGPATPPGWVRLPVLGQRFAATVAATGTASLLHTGIAVHLGAIRIAATPIVDLTRGTASGALSLRAPSAVALLEQLGGKSLLGEQAGLGWPGAGSASLLASIFMVGGEIGLPDFVASFGGITMSGRLTLATGPKPKLTGAIDAGTLILPASHTLLGVAGSTLASGWSISLPRITAARVDQNEAEIAGNAGTALALQPGKLGPELSLTVGHADVAGGRFDGSAELTEAAGTTPQTLSVAFHIKNGDAGRIAAIGANAGFLLPFAGGDLNLATSLTASGATPSSWLDSLAGRVSGSASKLTVSGFDLAKTGATLADAVTQGNRDTKTTILPLLRRTLISGQTVFDSGDFSAAIAKGQITIDSASLTGASGDLAVAGTVDLAHHRLNLTATAKPVIVGQKTSPALP